MSRGAVTSARATRVPERGEGTTPPSTGNDAGAQQQFDRPRLTQRGECLWTKSMMSTSWGRSTGSWSSSREASSTGQIAPALRDLVERDLIRVLDLLVLKKDADGTLEAFELSDLDEGEIGELRDYEAELAMLLSEEDVTSLAAAIEPGSSAAVLVWENTWAAPFASAVRRSGGQLVASGRIPIQAMLAAIEADEKEEAAEDTASS